MIELRNVSMSYGRNASQNVLKDLNLKISAGEVVLLCGESGCGKSSLLRLLNGVARTFGDAQISGQVLLNGDSITETEPQEIAEHVGSVFQNPKSQFFTLEVLSELAFGCENLGVPPDEIHRRINQVRNDFGLQNLMDRQLFQLSGGQKQKIACAAVAAMQPEVLLLDEPSSNLDLHAIDALQEIVTQWRNEGRTILVAEHRLSYLADVVDRVLVMKNGQIQRELTGDSFRSLSDRDLNALGLRSTNPVPAVEDQCQTPVETVKVEELQFTYPKAKAPALDVEYAELPKSQVIGVVGRNGAGKSTFVRSLTGIEPKSMGTVTIGTRRLSHSKHRLRCSYLVMQDVNHQLFGESVEADVVIGTAQLSADEKFELTNVLAALDLEDKRDRHPMSLSGGERQRVAIASALLSNREIIVFDEPTSGLDLKRMQQVAQLLDGLAEQNKTILVVTHDVELLANCCDYLVVIEDGRIAASEPCTSAALERVVAYLRGHYY